MSRYDNLWYTFNLYNATIPPGLGREDRNPNKKICDSNRDLNNFFSAIRDPRFEQFYVIRIMDFRIVSNFELQKFLKSQKCNDIAINYQYFETS